MKMTDHPLFLGLTKMEYDVLVKIIGAAVHDPTLPLHCPENEDFSMTFTSAEVFSAYRVYHKILANNLNA